MIKGLLYVWPTKKKYDMKVNFFNTPYLVYKDEMKLRAVPYIYAATEHCIVILCMYEYESKIL